MGFGIGNLLKLGNKLPLKLEGLLPKPFRQASPVTATNKLKDLFVNSFQVGGQSSRNRSRPNIGHRHGRFEAPHAHEGDK